MSLHCSIAGERWRINNFKSEIHLSNIKNSFPTSQKTLHLHCNKLLLQIEINAVDSESHTMNKHTLCARMIQGWFMGLENSHYYHIHSHYHDCTHNHAISLPLHI